VSTNHEYQDIDKYNELKAREAWQRFISSTKLEPFITAEDAFVAGYMRGIDYGKATYNKKEEYR